MTTPLTFPDHHDKRGSARCDRRTLLKGAAALAATAVTMKAASAATVTPFGQTGAITLSTDPLCPRHRLHGRAGQPVAYPRVRPGCGGRKGVEQQSVCGNAQAQHYRRGAL